jgi:signal transduction histidine kinase
VVSGITLITISVNFLNSYFISFYASFPTWLLYLVSAIIISSLGYFIWLKLRESDMLKYEFVTTATHKFRTPLTHIKWATENLEKTQTPEERLNQLEYIKNANAKLVELTSLLTNVSEADSSGYEYHLERNDISVIIEKTLNDLSNQFSVKHQQLAKNIEPGLYVLGDTSRIGFIIQTLVENAIHYTGEVGTITVSVSKKDRNVVCSVKDNGIGIPKEELPHLFSKFYRGSQARLADTEGMGIGLYITKGIITRHKGKIWAESDGTDRGSTFSFSLPVVA